MFKNMVVHSQVTKAHLAGCAAGKQGKFKEFKNTWWEKAYKTHQMEDDNILAIAKEIGLNMEKFRVDKDGPECKAMLQADVDELRKFHVGSTPTFFVNGSHVGGALPKESFKQMIDEKLKTADGQADYYDRVIMGTGLKEFKSAEQ